MKGELGLTEEMLKSSILNEKWIFHGYKFDLKKPGSSSHEEFLHFCEKNMQPDVLDAVMAQMFESDSVVVKKFLLSGLPKEMIYIASMQKNPTARVVYDEDYNYSLLIRFVDMTEKSIKKAIELGGTGTIKKEPDEEREYNFSPIQMLKAIPIMPNVELGLIRFFNARQHEFCNSFHYDEDNKPIVQGTDGIVYNIYPIEKRAELFSKYPKFDKKLFGLFFKDFVSRLLSKKDDSNHMKKYCLEVENILDKYKIDKLKEYKLKKKSKKLIF